MMSTEIYTHINILDIKPPAEGGGTYCENITEVYIKEEDDVDVKLEPIDSNEVTDIVNPMIDDDEFTDADDPGEKVETFEENEIKFSHEVFEQQVIVDNLLNYQRIQQVAVNIPHEVLENIIEQCSEVESISSSDHICPHCYTKHVQRRIPNQIHFDECGWCGHSILLQEGESEVINLKDEGLIDSKNVKEFEKHFHLTVNDSKVPDEDKEFVKFCLQREHPQSKFCPDLHSCLCGKCFTTLKQQFNKKNRKGDSQICFICKKNVRNKKGKANARPCVPKKITKEKVVQDVLRKKLDKTKPFSNIPSYSSFVQESYNVHNFCWKKFLKDLDAAPEVTGPGPKPKIPKIDEIDDIDPEPEPKPCIQLRTD